MADLFDKLNPPSQAMYEIALLGDTDLGRFFNQELSAESRSVKQLGLSSGAGAEARIAVVPVSGVLTKQGSGYGVSTMELAAAVTALANGGAVDGIALWIDSPGGEAAYVYDAVDAIRAAAQKLPIHAHISDLGASAAYAIASACSQISINTQGSAGSIGTYIVVRDWSAFMQKMGVKTYVLSAEGGTFKGMGTIGTELTAEQQDYLRQRADSLNQLFLKTVSTGRRLSAEQTLKLADGRVHIGAEALKLGLVDAVCSFETALQTLAMSAKPRMPSKPLPVKSATQGGKPMEPATFEELEQALPKAFGDKANAEDAQWGMKLMKTKPTLDQARQAWNQRLEEKLEAQQTALAEQQKAAEKQAADAAKAASAGGKKLPGVTLPGQTESAATGAGAEMVQEYSDMVAEKMKLGMQRLDAVVCVNRQRPDLHQAYLNHINANRKDGHSPRAIKLIDDKFKVEAAA